MSWDCYRLRAAVVDFADGALDDRSRDRVERHLTVCPSCAATVLELREVPAELRNRLSAEPSEEFWTRQRKAIMAAVDSAEARAPHAPVIRSRLANRPWHLAGSVAAAAAVATIAVGWWSMTPPGATQLAKVQATPQASVTESADDSSTTGLEAVVNADPWAADEGSLLSLADQVGEDVGEASEDSLI